MAAGFEFTRLSIPDIVVITPPVFGDDRGFFMETYKESAFRTAGIEYRFVQDNHSRSVKGVLRGLHYQLRPKAQGKMIRCIFGSIYDVCVDIRKSSPTYGRWAGCEITDQNRRILFVPPGFAHGFLVLSDIAEIVYKCTDEYDPSLDRGILWNDPAIGITWPDVNPILSQKDARHPFLHDTENNFV